MYKITLMAILFAWMIPVATQSQGCMDASSEEGVSVAGFFQPQFEYKQGENEDQNSFTFNRARVAFLGNIPYDVSYYFVLETSAFKNGNPYLLDAFITYSRFDYAKVSIGQFKSPFSLELNTACSGLHTINRSMVVDQLVSPQRDLGLLVFGDYKKIIHYNFAVMNGTGLGLMDENEGKDFVGRVVVSPFDFISVGGSFKIGTAKPIVEGADEDERTRFGGELQIKYDDFMLQGEYIYGEDIGSYTTGGGCGDEPFEIHQGSVERSGFFVQAMYMTPWDIQPVIKYESFDQDMNKDYDSKDRITFGLNYFLNDWTRVQINYLYCTEESSSTDWNNYNEINNDQLLLQVQVKF
ncbi:hypothetical protein KAH27_10305 [bacterium]|nr:hypothetical protein [bacterium]